ncbi:MAG TPA: hypothetical protein VLA74_14370 [Nitrososphaeraceae archaeon]|nr:hypothetical protein [Nitrososphaeraceae archaeon]
MNQSHSYKRKRPIENLFKNDIARVLDLFIFNSEFSYSTKELSDLTEIPYQNIQRILITLVKKKIILAKKSGNMKSFSINNNSELSRALIRFVHQSVNMEIDQFIKNSPEMIIKR